MYPLQKHFAVVFFFWNVSHAFVSALIIYIV